MDIIVFAVIAVMVAIYYAYKIRKGEKEIVRINEKKQNRIASSKFKPGDIVTWTEQAITNLYNTKDIYDRVYVQEGDRMEVLDYENRGSISVRSNSRGVFPANVDCLQLV